MADCLRLLTPLGPLCAASDRIALDASSSAEELNAYAELLRDDFLQPALSSSAVRQLRLIAAVLIVSSCLGVAYLTVLAKRQRNSMNLIRWLMPVEGGVYGRAHLAEPGLAWTIPMTIATTLLAAGAVMQSTGVGVLDTVAFDKIATLLFLLAAWLQFPGAILYSFRMRFGRLTMPLHLFVWLGAGAIFASMSNSLEHLLSRCSRAYEDGVGLHDTLLEVSNQWTSVYAANYTSWAHDLNDFAASTNAAAFALERYTGLAAIWLVAIALIYIPLALVGLAHPRSQPVTPGLGLVMSPSPLRDGMTQLSSSTNKKSTLLDEVEYDGDSDYTHTAKTRLAAHLSLSMTYGSLIGCSLLNALSAKTGERYFEDGLWSSSILPGWTHALGTLIVNVYLLTTLWSDSKPALQLMSPIKKEVTEKTPRRAFEVSTPLRSQVRIDFQRTPAMGSMTPLMTPSMKRRKPSRDFGHIVQILD